jgi:hypothetical protein
MNTDFTTTAKKAQVITRRPSILVHIYGITIVEGNLGKGYLGNRKRPGEEKQ